jgi:hypothetical protein
MRGPVGAVFRGAIMSYANSASNLLQADASSLVGRSKEVLQVAETRRTRVVQDRSCAKIETCLSASKTLVNKPRLLAALGPN